MSAECTICRDITALQVATAQSPDNFFKAIFCPACGRRLDDAPETEEQSTSSSTVVTVSVESVLDTIRQYYKSYGYMARFNRTATRKKVVSALKSKDKAKRLRPYEIIVSFRLYLYEEHEKGTDAQFIKQSETFMTNQVYDYRDRPAVQKRVAEMMLSKYGSEWQKTKFAYV